jgi:hypothetical protein
MENDDIIKRVLEIYNDELYYDCNQDCFFLASRSKHDILESEFSHISDKQYREVELELNKNVY